ncbi:methionyl-tRNA formyltransferase [Oceanobacillus profundus]|uniref:Methionyl-tRNA formyltransferase n=1 Tax=Oceanobacillus profundus TaxID=372463 RepID=A0A417YK55_9BACI|nr:methionyl-tRNA formyltransferase [Oceanobacillus profundus]MBR3119444.1 methionyl-tRNA formyltransferase [Oceanobacillus sp.]PAE29968.1 methionyl-tRNA formyltransferase [Paenibacillus sp. 7884-2]MCM3396288.1 methionyl-tRNA formyltransferase [Oceanobacillus profundus]MDO6449702.1 methionyl-tRNA formyltransferase [Oceanobacillus profundus]RHW33704.1 methionyl-tRNA formyltransferase [Oceanobacillus profundus]
MKRIVFMGTPDFSVPVLQTLINSEYEVVLAVTQPDRPKGRKRVITPPPVKVEAEKANIPVFQPEKLKDEYEEILSYNPDLIVTAAYGQLLPNELLENPPYGCINVHASLLPELRGGAPIHYAIMEGKKETGITIMYMVEKLDAGDILTQRAVPIERDDHVGSMHDKLSQTGASLLMETLPKLFLNELQPKKQDNSKATFASNIKREQEKIDWNQDNIAIYNQIRGMHPWPVAFTTYEGNVMKIWWGNPVETLYDGRTPGEIVEKIGTEGFVVVCGNQKGINVTEIQPAGKKRMFVKDYLQASEDRIKIGTVLGE